MLTLLALVLFGVSRPATNFNFIEVYGKIVGKKLTICDSKDSVRVEKLDVKFGIRGDTLIVEIKGDNGITIGGAGALLGLPPHPTKIYLVAITSNMFLDIEKLPLKSLNIQLRASSLTIVDDENIFPSCDSISITSSVSTVSFVGAGSRRVKYVNFHLNSSIVKIYFSGLNWESNFFNSTFSSISLSGLLPRMNTKGFLNIRRGLTPPRTPGLTINFRGSFNFIKFMSSF